jgi:sigma-B regulation protein RsbU (phosphoserine phosphatase)
VSDSGRFMTLAFVRFDLHRRTLSWVRAGHPPVLVYDPEADRFRELKGSGLPLGVEESFVYESYLDREIGPGQIVVIGTDGIWESVDRDGAAYGMERFCTVIRENARSAAQDILDAVYADLKAFALGARQADDITLVVAKLKDGGEPATDWAI